MTTYPSAKRLITSLKRDLGVDAIPAYRINSTLGLYVAEGLAQTFGPSIMVRTNPLHNEAGNADAATALRAELVFLGYQVDPAKHSLDTIVRVNYIPTKSQVSA
jgi:hypothetical protein